MGVVTTVHDCQVFDALPSNLFKDHDVPVDIIVTPTQVIRVSEGLEKPLSVFWNILTWEKFKKMGILKQIRLKEKLAGVNVTLKDEEEPRKMVKGNDNAEEGNRQSFKKSGRNIGQKDGEDDTSRTTKSSVKGSFDPRKNRRMQSREKVEEMKNKPV